MAMDWSKLLGTYTAHPMAQSPDSMADNSTGYFHLSSPFEMNKNVPLLFFIHKETPFAYSLMLN